MVILIIRDSQSPSRTSGSMSHLHGTDEPRAARLVEMRHGVLGVYPSQQVVHDQNITHTHTHIYLYHYIYIYHINIYTYTYLSVYIYIYVHVCKYIYIYKYTMFSSPYFMRFYYI